MLRAFSTVRFRLTAWYCLVHLVGLGFFGILVYGAVRHQLIHHHDGALERAAASVVEVLGQHEDCAHLTDAQVAELDALGHLVLIHEVEGQGEVFYQSPEADAWLPSSGSDRPDGVRAGFVTTGTGLGQARVLTRPYTARSGRRGVVRIMEPLGDVDEPLHTFRDALMLLTPLALLVSFGGGYVLAGRALRPVDRLTGMAREITATNLAGRLPQPEVDDELGRLVRVFNEMIERLQTSFEGMKRFTSDAAHELRSPLANLRSTADVTLGREREPQVYRDALASVREEVVRLQSIVEDLLVLARADSGKLRLIREPLRLDELAHDIVESFEDRSRAAGVELSLADSSPVVVDADERWLRQVASNLVDNAIKFTAAQPADQTRSVTISVAKCPAGGQFVVSDTGPGLPAGAAAKVFERFFRADPARARSETDGFGLGLSIADSIVRAHGGTIKVCSNAAGGCTFTVQLPAVAS